MLLENSIDCSVGGISHEAGGCVRLRVGEQCGISKCFLCSGECGCSGVGPIGTEISVCLLRGENVGVTSVCHSVEENGDKNPQVQ